MATGTQATQPLRELGTRHDDIFFPSMAVLILVAVFVGFAQTYYLSGVLKIPPFKAILGPPLPVVVHLHAVAFSSWIILLVVQTSLVARHRVDLHRRLGSLGFALACLMMLVGLAATCVMLARFHVLGDPKLRFPFLQAVDLTVFSTLIYFGYRQRFNPAAHKRLMLLATVALLDAAFSRWPILVVGNSLLADMCCYALLALLAGYDLWSTRTIHPATLWGGTLLVLAHHPILSILDRTVVWHRLAIYMQRLGDVLH